MLQHGVEAGRYSAALALVWLRALPNTALSWPRPVQNSPGNTRPGAQPVQNSPRNIPPAPQPVQNSPRNIPPAPQPVQNTPSTHKISKIQPFWTCRANFLSLLELTQPAGRTFSRIRRHSTQHTHSPSPNRYKTRPATPHQHPNRYKTHPATPHQHPNRYKTHPATHHQHPNRYKTHPATRHQHPNRYKTRPAHTKSAKFSHFGHAGRTFSRSWS